jgi:hypothetical protein
MDLKQLKGLRFRLLRELSIAYSSLPWQTDWIDRLTRDLAAADREIALQQSVHATQSEPVSSFIS